jgi:hypothetical protein
MKPARRPTVLCIVAVALWIGASSAQAALVYNDNGELVGEFAGIYDGNPASWTVYNSTLDRLFVIESTSGGLSYLVDSCPHFALSNCTGQPHLEDHWRRWIIRCGSRYFRATDDPAYLSSPHQLTFAGGCTSSASAYLTCWEAEEMLASDFPFELGQGPLRLSPGATTQSLLAIPTTGRWGLVALALVLLWQGVRRLQKLATHKA